MAGTVVFQTNDLATPGPGIVVGQDDVNGTAWQYVKIDVGPAGTTRPISYAGGTGVPVQAIRPASNFGTRIAGTVGNVILLDANPNRIGATLYLESGSALFLKLGSSAGTFDYTVQMIGSAYYEVPYGYSGTISGIWQFAGGSVQVTEVR